MNYKGGRRIFKGYILVKEKSHPNSDKDGYIFEHRLIMSKKLKRPLTKGETVHHRNGTKTDNRIKNLELRTNEHPEGQSVDDMVKFCKKYLKKYSPRSFKPIFIFSVRIQ